MSDQDFTNYMAITVKSGCISSEYQIKGKGIEPIVIPKDTSEFSGVFYKRKKEF